MRVLPFAALALAGLAAPAAAAGASGPNALALAGLIAEHDWRLAAADRYVVAALFAGNEGIDYPPGRAIAIGAEKVVCRVSNVEITARSCQLTIKGRTANLSGAAANALFATLAAAGVPADGAAGSIFEAVHGLACTLTPSVIKQNGGGGASCAYKIGP